MSVFILPPQRNPSSLSSVFWIMNTSGKPLVHKIDLAWPNPNINKTIVLKIFYMYTRIFFSFHLFQSLLDAQQKKNNVLTKKWFCTGGDVHSGFVDGFLCSRLDTKDENCDTVWSCQQADRFSCLHVCERKMANMTYSSQKLLVPTHAYSLYSIMYWQYSWLNSTSFVGQR